MNSRFTDRFGTFLGIGLLLLAIVGFLLVFVLALPTQSEVDKRAKLLREIPEDLFSANNPVNKTISGLRVPPGVPVTVSPENVGRSNVFENY